MNIFNFISLFGGLAFFLFGMKTMSTGLEKAAGGKLEKILQKMTDTRIKSLILGIAIAATIQSSSAVTVMLVGLVNSGIMQISQSVGVIMGSNIGTTVTAWLLSLAGIESDNIFINLLRPASLSPLSAFIGILLITVCKNQRKKNIGIIFMGFSVLMFGMEFMSESMSPLAQSEGFKKIALMFDNPILALAAGIVMTALLQSSSAAIGIVQALSLTGAVSIGAAIPIITGLNIGTCITAVISSFGVNKNAKKVAAIHINFNVIGTAIILTSFYLLNAIFDFSFADNTASPADIAAMHSIFNIATTAILFPFSKQIEKISSFAFFNKKQKDGKTFIDERIFAAPSVAVAECRKYTLKMAEKAAQALSSSASLVFAYEPEKAKKIFESEQTLDSFEDKLGSFLVKASALELSVEDANTVSVLLQAIGDLERIGDHASSIAKSAEEIAEKNIVFSENAKIELETAEKAVNEILEITCKALKTGDKNIALEVEPLEKAISRLLKIIKKNHISRLTNGKSTTETGFIISDLITSYQRVADHCSNLAMYVIGVCETAFDSHRYLNEYRNSADNNFEKRFQAYKTKYDIQKIS